MNQHASSTTDALLYSWGKNLGYAKKLVADVSNESMVAQPADHVNHPAWVLSHLNAYHGVIASMVQGKPFDDPIDHPFGMKSKPIADAAVYPSIEKLIQTYAEGHREVTASLQSAKPQVLDNPVLLDRWKSIMPTIHTALVYLMILHESTHLGQLSAWRRVRGMPSV